MKERRFYAALAAAVLLSVPTPVFAEKSTSAGEPLFVKVRSTAVRKEPKAWAAPQTLASYGDSLSVVSLGESWIKVKTAKGVQGYVHATAVTPRKVVLSTKGLRDSEVDPSEVVMAGKGFSKQVEQQYAAANSGVNLREVDKMEKLSVKPGELAAFIRAGKLGGEQ